MRKTPENGLPHDGPETGAPEEQDWGQNQPYARQWALLAGLALLVFCGLAIFLISAYNSYQIWAAGRVNRAAQVAATATAEVQQRLSLVDEARNWPVLIQDDFDSNRMAWLESQVDDIYTFDNFELQAP